MHRLLAPSCGQDLATWDGAGIRRQVTSCLTLPHGAYSAPGFPHGVFSSPTRWTGFVRQTSLKRGSDSIQYKQPYWSATVCPTLPWLGIFFCSPGLIWPIQVGSFKPFAMAGNWAANVPDCATCWAHLTLALSVFPHGVPIFRPCSTGLHRTQYWYWLNAMACEIREQPLPGSLDPHADALTIIPPRTTRYIVVPAKFVPRYRRSFSGHLSRAPFLVSLMWYSSKDPGLQWLWTAFGPIFVI